MRYYVHQFQPFVFVCVVLAAFGNHAIAQEAKSTESDLPFLAPGHDYIIRFPGSIKLFESVTSHVSPTRLTSEDGSSRAGRPATFTLRIQVDIFTVVKLGKAGWALLEHPAAAEDFAKWNGKCRAKALLSEQNIATLQASADRAEHLKRLRDDAAADIKTTRTWVNLAHAIAIADVPGDLAAYQDVNLRVQSVKVNE